MASPVLPQELLSTEPMSYTISGQTDEKPKVFKLTNTSKFEFTLKEVITNIPSGVDFPGWKVSTLAPNCSMEFEAIFKYEDIRQSTETGMRYYIRIKYEVASKITRNKSVEIPLIIDLTFKSKRSSPGPNRTKTVAPPKQPQPLSSKNPQNPIPKCANEAPRQVSSSNKSMPNAKNDSGNGSGGAKDASPVRNMQRTASSATDTNLKAAPEEDQVTRGLFAPDNVIVLILALIVILILIEFF